MATKRKAQAPKPDPVFAAIKAHKAAYAVVSKAISARGRLEAKLPQTLTRDPIFQYRMAYAFRTPADVTKHVNHYMADLAFHFGPRTAKRIEALKKPAERELKAMLAAHVYEHRRAQHAAGWTKVDEAVDRARDAEWRALKTLCETEPTTRAGVLAMLAYLGPMIERGDVFDRVVVGGMPKLFEVISSAVERLSA